MDEPQFLEDGQYAIEQSDDVVIKFEKVWFKYPQRPKSWILKDFNLEIFKGESIGLVGSSGSGKSTIAQLLFRFYDID